VLLNFTTNTHNHTYIGLTAIFPGESMGHPPKHPSTQARCSSFVQPTVSKH